MLLKDWDFKTYLKESPKVNETNWWNLPKGTLLEVVPFPKKIKRARDRIKLGRLLTEFGKNKSIEKKIRSISIKKNNKVKISFPIKLDNSDYVRLYSLMVSEGSTRTEFSIHCPEKEFHRIFKKSLINLLGKSFGQKIICKENKGFARSRAPTNVRFLIPISEHIPRIILKKKEFAKEYLRIAFDAEGSPILNRKQNKRYIKLSRSVDISELINEKLKYKESERIYIAKLKQDYPNIYSKLITYAPITLIGEHLLLKHYFNIQSKLTFEALRINKTSIRRGFYSARWTLLIYANNIDKFIKEINFISKSKQEICKKMKYFNAHNPQYSAFDIIKTISEDGFFYVKDFVKEMKKMRYVSPRAFMSRYYKKGLIKKVEYGRYEIISYP
ncbi:MAG: hypothetical protein AABW72_01235 [archaeon]